MKKSTKPKIAIAHDSFRYFGGAERIVEAFHQIWPESHIYTSTVAWSELGVFRKRVAALKPIVSWAQKIPYFPRYPFLYRYFLPIVWQSFDLSDYDIVISSSYAQMSHLVKVGKDVLHICYSHSPPRHLYGYETDFDWEKYFFISLLAKNLNPYLRRIDYQAACRVDYFIACSDEVAKRIKKYYKKNAIVIYPPLLLNNSKGINFSNKGSRFKGNYYLSVARLSRRKHVDLIIRACMKLDLSLKIVGTGPEEAYLRKIAGKNVDFIGQIDSGISEIYKDCIAVICAGKDEESSIVPIEAMSFGKPVIAYYSGGYKETVVDGKTGVFFKKLTVESLKNAILRFSCAKIDPENCIKQAEKFPLRRFKQKMRQFVTQKYREFLKLQQRPNYVYY